MRRKTHRSFLFLVLLLNLSFAACSKSSSSNTPMDASGTTASPTSNASINSPTSSAESEPVMPEKVQVAFEQNCKSCHGPDGHGITNVAPDVRTASRRTLKEWALYLKDEKGTHASTRIPAMSSLTDADYEAIGGYLADLSQNNLPPAPKK